MNAWMFANNHPLAAFFCVLAICWAVVEVVRSLTNDSTVEEEEFEEEERTDD